MKIHLCREFPCPVSAKESAAVLKNGTKLTYAKNISWKTIAKMSELNKHKKLDGVTVYLNPQLK